MATWAEIIKTSFQNVWTRLIGFLPNFIAAVIVLIVGVAIAIFLGKLVRLIIKKFKIDLVLEKLGVMRFFQKGGIEFSFAALLGWLVKWFLIVVFLIATTEILGLPQVAEFLNRIVLYLPNVIVAAVVLLVGIVLANFVQNWLKKFLAITKTTSIQFITGVAKWAIVIFSVLAALIQLKIATSLINVLFTGFVAMLAIAGGLAFGLAGKDWAADLISKIKKDISRE
jgi:hypothetical protein